MPRVSGVGVGEVDNTKTKFFESSQIVPPVNAVISAAHGFAQKPKRVQVVLIFKVAVNGYAIGDEVDVTSGVVSSAPATYGCVSWGATNIYLAAGAINYTVWDRTTGAQVSPGIGSFDIIFRGWK